MKKIIISILIVFTLSTFSFAGVVAGVEAEGPWCGLVHDHDCFDKDMPNKFIWEGGYIAGYSATLLWEFNTKDADEVTHYNAGVNVGVTGLGFDLAGILGQTYRIADLGMLVMELETSVKIGEISGLGFDYTFYRFIAPRVDLVIMPKHRRGLFAGIGLEDFNAIYGASYKGYGTEYRYNNVLAVHVIGGIRL